MKKISVYLSEAEHRALKSSLSAKGSNFQEFFHEAAKSAMSGATKRSISNTNTNAHDALPIGNDPLLAAISNLKGNRRAMVAIRSLVEALTNSDLEVTSVGSAADEEAEQRVRQKRWSRW